MLRHIMLASAIGLVATPALADPDKDESGHGRSEWRDDHRNGDRYYRDRDDRGYSRGIPAGHLPPPGECRVWFPDRPAGHQPPPMNCNRAERQADRYGGRVIYGSSRYGSQRHGYYDQRDFQNWALRNFDYNQNGRLSRREYYAALHAWNRRY